MKETLTLTALGFVAALITTLAEHTETTFPHESRAQEELLVQQEGEEEGEEDTERVRLTAEDHGMIVDMIILMTQEADTQQPDSPVESTGTFVQSLMLIEDYIVKALKPGHDRDRFEPLYKLIAAAILRHFQNCGVCETYADSGRAVTLWLRDYGNINKVDKLANTIDHVRIGWYADICTRRATAYDQAFETMPVTTDDARQGHEMWNSFNGAVASYMTGRIRRDPNITSRDEFIDFVKEAIRDCDAPVVVVRVQLLFGCRVVWDDTAGGHATLLVIDTIHKQICFQDPNVNAQYDHRFQYITDFLKGELQELPYTYMGFCGRSVCKGRHGGTCRYANHIGIYDKGVLLDSQHYMRRLTWVMMTMVNMVFVDQNGDDVFDWHRDLMQQYCADHKEFEEPFIDLTSLYKT